jgi:hypothetical protein
VGGRRAPCPGAVWCSERRRRFRGVFQDLKVALGPDGQIAVKTTVNSDPLEMFKALTVVELIMADLKGAASEEDKFLAIAKIVFKLIKENGK